ncbi:serine hydrolase domain-containing protein [Prosthecobacter sp.]|uniref:serine hydrolase domain-containing protein n=1 Tax=Prosthecobacter sp. TaxID=1965333 RepID=UPI0037848FF8
MPPLRHSPVIFRMLLAFGMLLTTSLIAKEYAPEDPREKDLLEFVTFEIEIEGGTWKDSGRFPPLVWQSPDRVLSIIGQCPLVIRWFDKELNELTKPNGKAPYVAYLDGRSEHGQRIRRMVTASPGGKALTAFPHPAHAASYDESQWLLDEQQIALKRKLLGLEHHFPAFKAPQKAEPGATVLHDGTPAEAGFKPESITAMRAACREWYESSKEPFVALVASHGIIVFHEAFDDPIAGTTTLDTPKHMASITKTMSAALYAEFMDQGLVNLDDPVGRLLPDFPVEGPKALTWRATFMHTAGLHMKAGSGREVHNAWSDNWAVNLLPCLTVGKEHRYNNMDTELTGKAMELITGRSVLRLLKENLFIPMGMTRSRASDVCHGGECTALDVAKFGQMLLNQGAYGDTRFFSRETFQKMLPARLKSYWPAAKFDIPWGMGLTYFNERDPRAGTDGIPADKTLLSRKTFCHGAASGAVLRIDPENEVVVTLVREKNLEGDAYKTRLAKFLLAVDEGIVERRP